MIQHTVVFRLNHPSGSDAESEFLREAKKLSKLPGVLDFHVYRQISRKNQFSFALAMYFSTQATYDAYNEHPEHRHFVNEIWLKQVADFMEIDYIEHTV